MGRSARYTMAVLLAAGCVASHTSPSAAHPLRPAGEGLTNEIDLQGRHGWCASYRRSFAYGDYHFASVEAYTFAPSHVNLRVTAADEADLRCEHAYTGTDGVRHDEVAHVHAFVNDHGVPVHAEITGTVGIPSPDSSRRSTRSSGFVRLRVHDAGEVVGYVGIAHVVDATGTAVGTQVTDKRSTLVLCHD
ncbi:MAG: hypothetical protein PVSMB7_26680 [Chloroflexota bacterium]